MIILNMTLRAFIHGHGQLLRWLKFSCVTPHFVEENGI